MMAAVSNVVTTVRPARPREREALLSVRGMRVAFGSGRRRFEAVRGVSFDVYKGETFGLAGESGSGKTTIGRAIIRVNPVSGGEVLFRGERISGRVKHRTDMGVVRNIQMIFQDPMASLNERAKVDYIVAEGLTNLNRRLSASERRDAVHRALLDVGLLPEFASRFPHEFSGGQRQRIGIARALIMNPSFIIADEPISALDVSIRAQVLNLMSRLQKERGLTYLFIAHDLSVMRFITDRIAVIRQGLIVELADTERLFENPLHPYTRALISAVPVPNPVVEKTKQLEVYDPSMHDYVKRPPEMVEIEAEHWVLGNAPEIEGYRKRMERVSV
ncbi:MAG: ABC transporter ATP-binding protein [Oscillospiraceae bacterium]|jgi:oligopeptide transport system ATP-binding protein|nr:ABC transporter ATP-binding protein [Oscillospiraceae bacterium]